MIAYCIGSTLHVFTIASQHYKILDISLGNLYLLQVLGQTDPSSVDLEKTLQNVAFDQGLHFLYSFSSFETHQQGVKWTCSNFKRSMVKIYGVPIFRLNLVV